MFFHTGNCEYILFEAIRTTSAGGECHNLVENIAYGQNIQVSIAYGQNIQVSFAYGQNIQVSFAYGQRQTILGKF